MTKPYYKNDLNEEDLQWKMTSNIKGEILVFLGFATTLRSASSTWLREVQRPPRGHVEVCVATFSVSSFIILGWDMNISYIDFMYDFTVQ